jgi:hypothetical protein
MSPDSFTEGDAVRILSGHFANCLNTCAGYCPVPEAKERVYNDIQGY